MNNAPEQPRMSSLDRRIEVARLRAERERAAAHPQPTQGLTSTMSTESCDIARPRNKQPLFIEELTADQTIPLAQTPGVRHCSVSMAMAVLRHAIQVDPDYARSWHDNIAMAFKDSWAQQAAEECRNLSTGTRNLVHQQANRAATHFMHLCFNADTSKHADEVTATAKALAADPVHTIIQQEAATAETQRFVRFRTPSFSGRVTAEPNISLPVPDKQSLQACSLDELKIYSEAIGYEARLKLMQEALIAASKPLISQAIARDFGPAVAQIAAAWQEDQQARPSEGAALACLKGAIPAYLTDAQQASQQAQLAAGDNTLRGIGNGWINGASRTK